MYAHNLKFVPFVSSSRLDPRKDPWAQSAARTHWERKKQTQNLAKQTENGGPASVANKFIRVLLEMWMQNRFEVSVACGDQPNEKKVKPNNTDPTENPTAHTHTHAPWTGQEKSHKHTHFFLLWWLLLLVAGGCAIRSSISAIPPKWDTIVDIECTH